MLEELDESLCEAYPGIYRYRNETDHPISAGFECHNGWYNLIYDLSEILAFIEYKSGIQITAEQVKQKGGELRFYYNTNITEKSEPEEIPMWFNMIGTFIFFAELRSRAICEICGKAGLSIGPPSMHIALPSVNACAIFLRAPV